MASEDVKHNLMYEEDVPVFEATSASQLRQPVNLQDFLSKSVKFEVDIDGDEGFQGATGFDNVEEAQEEDIDYYCSEYLQTKPKFKFNEDMILASVGSEEAAGRFDGIVKEMTNVTGDGQIKKLIVRKGTGKRVASDGKVWYNYLAYAEGQTSPFDSSFVRGVVDTVTFSREECIEGVSIALRTMEVSEVAKFWIHYEYAFGKLGVPPRIPPESPILCTIQIVDVMDGDKLKSVFFMSPEDRANLSFKEIIDGADELRTAGNGFYTVNDYYAAIKRYRKGIDFLDNYTTMRPQEDEKRCDLLATIYCNLAQAYLKAEQFGRACIACHRALKLPHSEHKFKIFYRFAQAKHEFGHNEKALRLCHESLKRAPSTSVKEIKTFMAKLERLIKEEDIKSRSELAAGFKKMFVNEPTKKS